MKKLIIKIVTIAAAFLLGVVGMSYYLTAGNTDSTAVMAEAELPLIYLEKEERLLNLMHGYTGEIDASYVRDAVFPLDEERRISMQIDSPDVRVEHIFYEVRSLDTSRLIEDGEITDSKREENNIYADLKLKDLLDDGEEYLLVIRLDLEKDREASYYARVANVGDTHLGECIDFVDLIHEALFDKENTVSIAQYLETDPSADSKTLDHVTIHSRYKQLIWGDMEIQPPKGKVRTYITEIEDAIASIRLEYEVEYVNDKEETECYEVQEAYRVRYTPQRMYLLNYDRKTDRIFDPSLSVFSKNSLELGILSTETVYKKNEEENIAAFVQNGQLWSYDAAQNKLALVFGFRDGEDLRGSFEDHGIRILNVAESGSIDFLVYGYMNRGNHEGETGTALYYYDALANSVEERVFLESDKPFAVLESQMGNLAYVSKSQQFYLYLDGSILRIDLNTREYETIASGIAPESGIVSEDGKWAAWHQENSLYASKSVAVLNLETGESRVVSADDGCYIRGLGFMGTDFIYGQAREEDVQKDITGNKIFPMGRIVIENEQGEELRIFDYEAKGKYVVSVSIESNRVSQECVRKTADGSYEPADPEPITNKTVEIVEKISLETKNSGDKMREYYFSLSGGVSGGKLRRLMPKQVVFEGSRNLTPVTQTEDGRYYAYGFDGVFLGGFSSANEAVLKAYDHMGTVVDADQAVVWSRGGRKLRTELRGIENPQAKPGESSLQAAVEILLGTQKTYGDVAAYLQEGFTPYEILEKQTEGRVLDLSGCSVSMTLYYVSRGYPVLALEGGTQAELIVGYDVQNILLLDPLTGEIRKEGMNDGTQRFEEMGNLFLVCMAPEKA